LSDVEEAGSELKKCIPLAKEVAEVKETFDKAKDFSSSPGK
jgi:hypothetical protein